MTWTGTRSSEG